MKTFFSILLSIFILVSCSKKKTVANYNGEIQDAIGKQNFELVESLVLEMNTAFQNEDSEKQLNNLAQIYSQNMQIEKSVEIYQRLVDQTKNTETKANSLFMMGYILANDFDPPQKEKAKNTLSECLKLIADSSSYFFQSVKSELLSLDNENQLPDFLNQDN